MPPYGCFLLLSLFLLFYGLLKFIYYMRRGVAKSVARVGKTAGSSFVIIVFNGLNVYLFFLGLWWAY